jgi:20S proteasome alpha/beta subunit
MQRMIARLPRVHMGEDMNPETAAKLIKRLARTVRKRDTLIFMPCVVSFLCAAVR